MEIEKFLRFVAKSSVVIGVAGLVPKSFLYNVDGGEQAVLFRRFGGIDKTPVGEGTHFKIPWLQIPFIYDVRMQPKVISTATGTKDLQTVSISVRLLYRPKIGELPNIHKQLGRDYAERVLPSIGNEILKAVVAKYDAESLLTSRAQVSQDIRSTLLERAAQFGVILDDVAITHLAYGKEFTRAIEDKQVAQQEAERVRFVVMRSEQERQAAVIRAEGVAEAAKMISQALKEHGDGLLLIRRIDTAKEIAASLGKSKNVTWLTSKIKPLLSMPVV